MKNAKLSLGGDNSLIVVVEDGLPYDYLSNPENQSRVEDMISNHIQKEVKIRVQRVEQGHRFEESYVDLAQVINMEIEIEDEE